MADNKNPAITTRPRLLSDILENPLSESTIPEDYTMHRSPVSPAPPVSSRLYGGQGGLPQPYLSPYQQSRASQNHAVASAPDPGIIGQPLQRTSSSTLLSQGTRLQPLTPVNPPISHRYHENRRSMPSPLPAFTTSPGVSDAGSPSHSRFPSLERSFSQASLNAPRYPSHPRTPTPSSNRAKAKISDVPRSSSLPSSPKHRRPTPHPHGKPSVKHLTCFWWKVKGDCRFSEDDCLYAHRETGLLADAPRQVTPGEPAKAGRHLEKALSNLRTKRNPSSSSLNTSMVANPSTPESQGTSSLTTTPVDAETFQERVSSLQSDNTFLRNLVEQSSKEKSVLMTTIEGLQKENANLNKDVEYLKDVVDQLQQQKRQFSGSMLFSDVAPERMDNQQRQASG
ncbi:hypothetical protein EPUS_06795 [Endocarpon pusillum Z07020]|uniref:C3H1-type domain-containing protein n=1 Tax=Endocarpon pusillum (strain Z07020 / HMAS-L-300199) TaxID=1263415 RepID=U1HHP0_ENDPU|nr:uncharacterized protein EPUS_06795 [Endocarpon pusillum Z07020]ERF68379.1 hypothetical protein EPUS_06795 [Endocarpon pusillum Z07020]